MLNAIVCECPEFMLNAIVLDSRMLNATVCEYPECMLNAIVLDSCMMSAVVLDSRKLDRLRAWGCPERACRHEVRAHMRCSSKQCWN
eukprot:15468068-Alexandrium_andersonii.AAC.1